MWKIYLILDAASRMLDIFTFIISEVYKSTAEKPQDREHRTHFIFGFLIYGRIIKIQGKFFPFSSAPRLR